MPIRMGFTKSERPHDRPMSRRKVAIFIILGISFGIIDIGLMAVDPVLIIAKYCIRVDYGTFTHEALTEEIDSIHLSVYVFNITNAERFQAGVDHTLKVEEVGPFTYQEMRHNENVEFNFETNSIHYTPKIYTRFLEEESVARPEDVNITMPNLAMLSLASKVSGYSFIPRMGFNMLTNRLQTKSIIQMSAKDYLWGYEDPLIKLGNTIMPGLVTFDVIGILDRLYDKKIKLSFELSTKNEDRFSIKSVNGCQGLDKWNYNNPKKRTRCNSFINAYEGIGYPTEMDGTEPLRLYRAAFCRILEMEYTRRVMTEYGFEGLEYTISDRSYQINNDTECLCSEGICLDGVSDLSPCFIGFPVVISNAHFLHADPKLYSRIEGIKPDEKKHRSFFVIEPKIGLAMSTQFSIQVNLLIRDVSFNRETSRFSDMVIPVVYFQVKQPPLVPRSQYHLKLMYSIGPMLVLGLEIVLGIASLLLLAFAARTIYGHRMFLAKNIVLHSQPSVDSRVPLMK